MTMIEFGTRPDLQVLLTGAMLDGFTYCRVNSLAPGRFEQKFNK